MTNEKLSYQIATFSRDFDPYEFDDCFDSLEECAEQVARMLDSEPASVYDALLRMIPYTADAEQAKEAVRLLYLASMVAWEAA